MKKELKKKENQKKIKLAVVTGTRAEFGLLSGLLEIAFKDPDLECHLLVTGQHLSREFGYTVEEIEKSGFPISEKIPILLASDNPGSINQSIGLGIIGFSSVFERIKPDLIVLLGDRFEIFSAGFAATPFGIPIAHIHGGEKTEGAIDEIYRHALTKCSHLHFTSNEEHRLRVIQLGENPKYVFNVGAPGLDNINRMKLLTRSELEKKLDFTLDGPLFFLTLHPETLGGVSPNTLVMETLKALEYFPEFKIIITRGNSDSGGREMIQLLSEFCKINPQRAKEFHSLGYLTYLSLIPHVSLVVGNSSSGIIEIPSFNKPSINIGNRQGGRMKAESVINCTAKSNEIIEAIKCALSLPFQDKLKTVKNPYGDGKTAEKIIKTIKKTPLSPLKMKKFHDL